MNREGRPLKFKSVDELQEKIDKYFNETSREELSITGLALALDTDRSVLCDYQERDEFTNTIKKAKLKVENAYELRLIKRGSSGDIFALKNFGWKDKQEVESNVTADVRTVDLSNLTTEEIRELLKHEDKE